MNLNLICARVPAQLWISVHHLCTISSTRCTICAFTKSKADRDRRKLEGRLGVRSRVCEFARADNHAFYLFLQKQKLSCMAHTESPVGQKRAREPEKVGGLLSE